MSRIDDLQKKYPSLPRQYIVRWDAKIHGIADNPDLDKVGQWASMAGTGTYASYDHDITLQDWVARNPGRFEDGRILRHPKFVLPENGLRICDHINTKSDVIIRDEGNGKYALYHGDERVEELLLQREEQKERRLASGAPEHNFLTRKAKYCFYVVPVRHCEFFPKGLQCKFCNFNPGQDDARSVGLQRTTTVSLDSTLEAYRQWAAERYVIEGTFECGAFFKEEIGVRLYNKLFENFAKVTNPHKPNFQVVGQPVARKNWQRLKDSGMESYINPMEVWDADLFAECAPGKAQVDGRERYLESYLESVDVLGAGNVVAVFAMGLTLIPEQGHKTWQEARDSQIEGSTWMIEHGVFPVGQNLRLPPGAVWGNDENRKKIPPTDFFMDIAIAQHDACKKYGLYEKLNRLMNCAVCSLDRPLLGNYELGAYELAGSLANWAEPVVPREVNWHRDWEEQRKSVPATQPK